MIDGVLVAPMRSGGLELLVGITKDPTFGPVMAVGIGGVGRDDEGHQPAGASG